MKTDSSLQNSPCSYVPDIYILSQTLALSQTVTLISHSYICICFKIHHADSTLQKPVTYSYVPIHIFSAKQQTSTQQNSGEKKRRDGCTYMSTEEMMITEIQPINFEWTNLH